MSKKVNNIKLTKMEIYGRIIMHKPNGLFSTKDYRKGLLCLAQ